MMKERPKYRSSYFSVLPRGSIIRWTWMGALGDIKHFDYGNAFETEKEARTAALWLLKLYRGLPKVSLFSVANGYTIKRRTHIAWLDGEVSAFLYSSHRSGGKELLAANAIFNDMETTIRVSQHFGAYLHDPSLSPTLP